MALVTCPDCAQEVSDSAPSCPKCGRPTPGGSCTLSVARPGRMLFLSPLEVKIDGTTVATLNAGQSTSVAISPGNHRLQCEITPPRQSRKIFAVDLQVAGSSTTSAEVTFSKLSGKPTIKVL